jgi:hypothetical protein
VGDHRAIVEQCLVDAAEFFDIERAVVHPAQRPALRVVVEREGADGGEQVGVRHAGLRRQVGACRFAEEVAIERRDREAMADAPLKDTEGGEQSDPEVAVPALARRRCDAGMFRQPTQPRHTVVRMVDGEGAVGVVPRGGDQVALFGDHQEEHAIDDAQRLAVELLRGQVAVGEGAAQALIRGVAQQSVRQRLQRLLYPVAQAVAHPPAFRQRLLMVAFEPALRRIGGALRQARTVEQAIEQGEIAELFPLQHRLEVELDIRRAGEARRFAQQTQAHAIGHDPPQVVGRIEVLLHQRVGRQAHPPSPLRARGGSGG